MIEEWRPLAWAFADGKWEARSVANRLGYLISVDEGGMFTLSGSAWEINHTIPWMSSSLDDVKKRGQQAENEIRDAINLVRKINGELHDLGELVKECGR